MAAPLSAGAVQVTSNSVAEALVTEGAPRNTSEAAGTPVSVAPSAAQMPPEAHAWSATNPTVIALPPSGVSVTR